MDRKPQRSRRGFMIGTATVGAAAAAVVSMPAIRQQEAAPEAQPSPPTPERGGGYHVSEHVKRYYKSTLV